MPKASDPTPALDAPLPVEYAVRIYPVKGSKYTLANANVDINGIFAIRGVKIINGEKGPFVAMPQYKDGHGDYHDICFPCTAEARQELVFFIIKPTNISVLPDSGVGARIYALLNVVKGMAEIEMLALNSKESFENNKAFYRRRVNEEELPVVRKLLEQDSAHLDRIQVLMASSREFYILVRLHSKKGSDVFSYLSRIEKSIKDNGFTVRRAGEQDLKKMLGVYFEQNVTTEQYEDHDGDRWIIFGE